MTPQEIQLVQTSFEKVAPIAETAAALFYGRLFEVAPAVRPLFGKDMRAQGNMLMQTLGLAVRSLHQPEQIVAAVKALGRRHVGYGARADHYPVVGDTLLWTLRQGLGDAFTADVAAAWAKAYALLAGIMQDAATEMPAG